MADLPRISYFEFDSQDAPTRAVILCLVRENIRVGSSPRDLALELRKLGIDREHAETIARTELIMANNGLNLESFRAAQAMGIEIMKGWTTGNGESVCPVCRENAAAGAVSLDQAFPSGHHAPPAHPRCRCCVAPHVPYAGPRQPEPKD